MNHFECTRRRFGDARIFPRVVAIAALLGIYSGTVFFLAFETVSAWTASGASVQVALPAAEARGPSRGRSTGSETRRAAIRAKT